MLPARVSDIAAGRGDSFRGNPLAKRTSALPARVSDIAPGNSGGRRSLAASKAASIASCVHPGLSHDGGTEALYQSLELQGITNY